MVRVALIGASAICCAVVASSAFAETFNYTGAIQTFTVPQDGYYLISATGATGGATNGWGGGAGARQTGVVHLRAGTVLNVVVGGAGGKGGYNDTGNGGGGGGGGGSFVYIDTSTPIVAGGGGGGAGHDGAGGSDAPNSSNGGAGAGVPGQNYGGAGGSNGSGGGGGFSGGFDAGGGAGFFGNGQDAQEITDYIRDAGGGYGGMGPSSFAGGLGAGAYGFGGGAKDNSGGFGGGGGAGAAGGGGGGGYSGGGGGSSGGQYSNESAGGGGGSFVVSTSNGHATLGSSLTTGANASGNGAVSIASTLIVTNTQDSGFGSLRNALFYTDGGTITFAIPTSDSGYNPDTGIYTIALSSAGDDNFGPSALVVEKTATIDGGANEITITRDMTANTPRATRLRLFYVTPAGTLTLRNVTLSNGRAQGGNGGDGGTLDGAGGGAAGMGGAILVNRGRFASAGCTFVNNQAVGGNGGSGVNSNAGGGGGLGGDGTNTGGPPNGGSTPAAPGGFGGGGAGADCSAASFFVCDAAPAGGGGGFGGGGGGGKGIFGFSSTYGGAGGFGGGGGGGGAQNVSGGGGGFGAGSGGNSPGGGGGGAGLGGVIFNYGGDVSITNSTLTANIASGGAGGAANVTPYGGHGSSGGAGRGYGGAIFNLNGTLKATNATIANNVAGHDGGGIYSLGDNGIATQSGPVLPSNSAAATLDNTIVSGSTNGANAPAVVTDYFQKTNDSGNGTGAGLVSSSGGHDIIQRAGSTSANNFGGTATNVDPKLNSLGSDGGVTQTMSLLASSPAIEAGAGVATLTNSVDGQIATTIVPVTNAGAFSAGLTIQVDNEQMLVTAVSGDKLTVIRVTGGTTIAAHSSGAVVNPAFDQRGVGFPRKLDVAVDVGAFEAAADTAPDTTIISPKDGSFANSNSVTISFVGTDEYTAAGLLAFEGKLDSGSFAEVSDPVILSGLAEGLHTYQVRARDQAGDLDPTPATVTFTVDTTAPTMTISAPSQSSAIGSSTVTYTVTYSDANFTSSTLLAANVTLNKSGTANATVTVDSNSGSTRIVTLSGFSGDGSLGISIAAGSAHDAAGNQAPAAGPSVTFVVSKVSPTVTTQASAPTTIGASISDTATLTSGASPAGTITFNVFGPDAATCGGTPVFTSTKTVSGNGTYTSTAFTPTAPGTYRFVASYSGDANNNAVAGVCNDANESVLVSKAIPTVTTKASSATIVGAMFSDSATVSGGYNPTGAITFRAFGPNDATCGGTPAFTATVTVNGNGTYNSGNFIATAPGTYRFVATYSGDANNNLVANACGDPSESVTVGKANPTITTQASGNVTLGGNISDTATLAGGVTPSGTVTFNVFGPNDSTCGGAPAFTSTVPVSGNAANSGNFKPVAAGTYRFVATYSGDALNSSAGTPCNDPNESVAVQPTPTPTATPTPTPSTTPTPTVTPTPTPTPTPGGGAQSVNISTRGKVELGDSVLIGGFIITGDRSKNVLVRAVGPSITMKDGTPVPDTLQDPVLELHGPNGSLILRNDNWKETQQQQIEESKMPPKSELESAIIATLPPGAYTAIVSGKNEAAGVALVEVFDLSRDASLLANISTRGFVQTADNVMIGGFMLGGSSTNPSQIAIRGLGPSLVDSKITNPLADPTLDLRDKEGNRITFNDNYTDDPTQAAQLALNGLTPKDPHESGILLTLQRGSYTVILEGKSGTATGIGLVEVYNLR